MSIVSIAAREAARATVRTTASYGLIIGAEELLRKGAGFFSQAPELTLEKNSPAQNLKQQEVDRPEALMSPSLG